MGQTTADDKEKKDFFVSYTGKDSEWAEWVAFVLEEEGYTAVLQKWDFRPGSNFAILMQDAASRSERTIMILSPAYLKSDMAMSESIAAFTRDPGGRNQKLVPIMVEKVDASGLLGPIVQIRIVGMNEEQARNAIVEGVQRTRTKPSSRPAYPFSSSRVEHKEFPGDREPEKHPIRSGNDRPRIVLPLKKAAPTDLERRNFLRGGFDAVRRLFEANIGDIASSEPRVHPEVEMRTSTDMRVEIYVDGTFKACCRIRLGGPTGENNITYSEARGDSDNTMSDVLSVTDRDELFFNAIMPSSHSGFGKNHDTSRMTQDEAAEYLWSRFVERLSH